MDVPRPVVRDCAVTVEIRAPLAIISAGPHRAEITAAIDDVERQGQPITLVCLDRSPHDHDQTRADVLHFPLLSAGILSSFILRIVREPVRVLGSIMRLLAAPAPFRLAAAVHVARVLSARGIVDVQGVDPISSRIASVVRQLCDQTPPDLSQLPVEWSRLSAGRIGFRWFSRRINSIAAEVSLDGDKQRVIVKRRRMADEVRSAVDQPAHEYRTLSALAEAMDDALTVPRVLLFDEQAATLVMERAPGAALDTIFATAAADHALIGYLAEGIRRAGAWLRAMQTATRRNAGGGALLAEVVSAAVEHAAKVAKTDRVIARHRRRIVQRLETLERSLRERPLTVAGHHGDYWPGNVFFDGRRVTVIDLESFRDGLWLEDAAYFLIRSDMLRRRFRLPLANLTDWFFEGYSPAVEPDADALQLFTLTKGLWTLATGVGEDLPMPQRVWTRRTIRKAVLRTIGN